MKTFTFNPFSHDIDDIGAEVHITFTVRTGGENIGYEFVLSESDAMVLSTDIERVVND